MRKHSTLTLSRIKNFRQKLENSYYSSPVKLLGSYFKSNEPVSFDDQIGAAYQMISMGDKWGERFDCAWFKFEGNIPQEFSNQQVVALIDLGGEACVYDTEGSATYDMTTATFFLY